MPRTGAVLGLMVACALIAFAWQSVYRDFYRIEIAGAEVRLYYQMPPDTKTLPIESINGMRKRITLGRGGKRRIKLETDRGIYFSGNMNRNEMDAAWKVLAEYIRPLD